MLQQSPIHIAYLHEHHTKISLELGDARPEPHINIDGIIKFDLTNQHVSCNRFWTRTDTQHVIG